MNYLKHILILVLAIVIGTTMLFPSISSAQTHFGGLDVYNDYAICDCTYATYVWFAPLYFSVVPLTGALTMYPPFVYLNYYLTEEAWALGHYIQTPACYMWVYAGFFAYCQYIPTMGHIQNNTGSSLPGAGYL